MKKSLLVLLSIFSVVSLHAAAPGEIVRGPVFTGTIMAKNKSVIAHKGLIVTLGANKRTYVCYDEDLLRMAAGWTGEFLEFGNTQTQIAWPPPPVVKGQLLMDTKARPGWERDTTKSGEKADGKNFLDPRPNKQGPLPKDQAHYKGYYLNGDNVILSYTVNGVAVLEMPGLETIAGQEYLTRTFSVGPSTKALRFVVGGATIPDVNMKDHNTSSNSSTKEMFFSISGYLHTGGTNFLVGVVGTPDMSTFSGGTESSLENNGGFHHETWLTVPEHRGTMQFKVFLGWGGNHIVVDAFKTALKTAAKPVDLAKLTKGGKAHWPETIVNQGVLGTNAGAYVVDMLPEPLPNPWNAKTFFGGFDFFPDGRAAICTFHGDVWIVSGIDAKMEKLTWRRYATGMFQPLGVKVVDGLVYVTCRDQITRLHDLNNDGEADFYENFNNDTVVTQNYHEFCLDLHTDSKGNFYYAKGAPWTPDVQSPHQGTILKVSKDGSEMEVIATGLRAPNGMGLGPRDEITVSDNQGHWMPSSKLNWIKPGGFYGMMPAAQREVTLRRADGTELKVNPSLSEVRTKNGIAGWDKAAPIPTSYDQPMLWFPMNTDNSSGGQGWITSDKWGPFKNHLVFMSYGKGTLFHVMHETVGGEVQAAFVQFPLKFSSGTMRARINPKDGQLYTCGLKGWQTAAARDGAFSRVRYTGKPVHAPLEFHVRSNGVAITFTTPLDAALASSPANYGVEQWNYVYSGAYGSPEVTIDDPKKNGHDSVTVNGVKLSADKKTVLLEMANVRPVMQMKIKINIKAADGTPIVTDIYNTIHKVGAAK